MRLITTFALITTFISQVYAQQVDQVSVGAAYSLQAYYTLESGDVQQVTNEDWDIAFSDDGVTDAGIFLNESAAFMASTLALYVSDKTDWSESITDVSGFTDDTRLYNAKENWIEGAFNSVASESDPLDYGWGVYNPQNFAVEGNKIYVVEQRNGSFLKLQIQRLADGEYQFRYAELDGSNEVNAVVSKNSDQAIVFYSLLENQVVDVPLKNADLIFKRYYAPLDDGTGNIIQYSVTGVLVAPGTEAVVADGVDPETVVESDYSDQYSAVPTVIGHDWKTFDFSAGWQLDFDRVHFVKTRSGDIYKVYFFDFEGSSTGITTLEKTFLTTVNNNEVLTENTTIKLFPNPAQHQIQIEGLEQGAEMQIFDNAGQMRAKQTAQSIQEKIEIQQLEEGLYHVIVRQKGTVSIHNFAKQQ